MNLTREQALKLYRQMWTDMQTELGNEPNGAERVFFKEEWCDKHFPGENIMCSCFLCEYVKECLSGRGCLIVWPYGDCTAHQYYYDVPISEILALPEREVE